MRCEPARTAYLAGEARHEELDHLETCSACVRERPVLDEMRAVLSDEATWAEPSRGMEQRVVAIVSGTEQPAEPAAGRAWWWVGGAGIAAALVLIVALVLTSAPAPDWEVAIPGTDRAPLASGVIEGWVEQDGTRLVLDIEGLPVAPAGSVYELWLTNADIHVSAGTFRSAGQPELWVGVSRAAFPRLWITLEPIDTDESPSGFTVMDTG